MTTIINARQNSAISMSATDLIGRAALLYHAGHALHPAVSEMYMNDIDKDLQTIADALGYSVSKIEAGAPPSSFQIAAE